MNHLFSTKAGVVGAALMVACGSACVATGSAGESPGSPRSAAMAAGAEGRACDSNEESFGPAYVTAEQYAARTGAMVQRFSELGLLTKERPLEECELPAVLRRLVTLQCDGGSNPFERDLRAAHASRAGNFGPGGRCGSIIDRYDVKCPERTYQVFADMYFCPKPLAEPAAVR
jgi:hypothetical protein